MGAFMDNHNHNKFGSRLKWLLGTGLVGICALGFVTIANSQDPQRIDPKSYQLTQKSASSSSSASLTAEEEAAAKAKLDRENSQSSSSSQTRPKITQKPIFTPLAKAPFVEKREAFSTGVINFQSAMKKEELNKQQGLKSTILAKRIDKSVLDKTSVPVIMPVASSKIDAAKAKLMSYGDTYALNMPQPQGMVVTIYGNSSFVKSEKGTVTDLTFKRVNRMAESVQITRLEDGWTASFTRYGVVYSVDLLCDLNSQCPDETQIRTIVADCSDVSMGSAAMKEAEKAKAPEQSDWLGGINKSISKTTQNLFKGA
jgi:hypothetical protein